MASARPGTPSRGVPDLAAVAAPPVRIRVGVSRRGRNRGRL